MFPQHQSAPVMGYPVGAVASHGLQGPVVTGTPVIPVSVQLAQMGVDVGTLSQPPMAARANVYGQAVQLQTAPQLQHMAQDAPQGSISSNDAGAMDVRRNSGEAPRSSSNCCLADCCLCVAGCFHLLSSCLG